MDRRLITFIACVLSGCGQLPAARPTGLPPDSSGLVPGNTRAAMGEVRPNLLDIKPDDPGSKENRGARIRALVNGQAILEEEVQASALPHLAGVRNEKEKAEVLNAKLNELIDRELVLQDADTRLSSKGKILAELRTEATKAFKKEWLHRLMKAGGFTDEEKFKIHLRESGMPAEMMQRQWERNYMAMEYVRGRLDPTLNRIGQAEVMAYFAAHADDFKVEESIEWQDLFVAADKHPSREAARQFAESLVKRAKGGEDFAKLVQTYDNGVSSLGASGAGIGTKRGEIRPPQAEPVLLSLKSGEIGPVIEMENGYHVVRLVKKTAAGRKEFDAALQRQIKDKLRGDAFVKEMKAFVTRLRRQATIEVAEQIK